MPFPISFALQIASLALFVLCAVRVVQLGALREGTVPSPGPVVPPGGAHDRPVWVLTLSSSALSQPIRARLRGDQDVLELGGSGYPLPSAALAEVSIRFRRDPVRRGLTVETASPGVLVNFVSVGDARDPYVVDGDEIRFAADDTVRIEISRAEKP